MLARFLSAAGVSIEHDDEGEIVYIFTSGSNDEEALREIDQDIAMRSLEASAAAAAATESTGAAN